MFKKTMLCTVLIVLGGSHVILAKTPDSGALETKFDTETGELTIYLDGKEVTVPQSTVSGGKTDPVRIWFKDPGMPVPLHGNDNRIKSIQESYNRHYSEEDQVVEHISFDPESRRLLHKYRWGEIVYRYTPGKERIDLDIEIRNKSDKSIWKMDFSLLNFALSRDSLPAEITEAYFGTPARAFEAIATFQPVVLPLLDGDLAVVACSPELEKPLTLKWITPSWYRNYRKAISHGDPVAQDLADAHAQALKTAGVDMDASQDVFWRLLLTLGGDQLINHDRYTTRTIAPGKTDTVRVSLRFGASDRPLEPAKDILAAFAERHPQILDWPDRRIILRSFIGDKIQMHLPSGPELVKPEPVEPDEEFRTYVMETAEQLIEDAKAVDAQGVIVWNIESPNHRFMGYVGDPRMVEYMSPEMNSMADTFFSKLSEAGLHTGVTLRPRRVHTRKLPPEWKGFKEKYNTESDWIYGATYPRDADDVVKLLSDMVQYAKDRWGCTLFYIDTNIVSWGPSPEEEADWPRWTSGKQKGEFINYRVLMNTDQWEQLLKKHPDCLFVPEHGGLLHYASTSPYSQVNMGSEGKPPVIAAIWPDAFKSLAMEGRDAKPENYDKVVNIFRNRDIVMANPGVRNNAKFYRDAAFEAALQGESVPAKIKAMKNSELLTIVQDEQRDQKQRYFAARQLLEKMSDDREKVLLGLLDSGDSTTVRMALMRINDAEDVVLLDSLSNLWVDAFKDRQGDIQSFVETAISRMGSVAIPKLVAQKKNLDVAVDLDPQAVEDHMEKLYFISSALGSIEKPEALQALDALLIEEEAKDRPNSPFVRRVKRILGKAGYQPKAKTESSGVN